MDWRDKRLTIRLWCLDFADRHPVIACVLFFSPFFVIMFLFAYLEVVVAEDKALTVESVAGAFAYTIITMISIVLSFYVIDMVEALFSGFGRMIVGWAHQPKFLVGLPIALTAAVWGGVALLTNDVSIWGILITYIILSGILIAAKSSVPKKKNRREENDHEARDAGLN